MIHRINIADMLISTDRNDLLITHALGSCLGITLYDPVAGVGGLLHVMMPFSSIDLIKADDNPYMFVDSGLPMFFKEAYKAGAEKSRLMVTASGGAEMSPAGGIPRNDMFQIGKRNFTILRKLLWANNLLLNAHDVGGNKPRTVSLDMTNGNVFVSTDGEKKNLNPSSRNHWNMIPVTG